MLQSNDGWHVVRLDSHRDGRLSRLEEVIDAASRIWYDDEVRKRAWVAVTRLGDFYASALHPLTDLQDVLLWVALGMQAGLPRSAS